MLYICSKGGNHLHEGPHIFLATTCTSFFGGIGNKKCDGIMVMSDKSRERLGIKEIAHAILFETLMRLPQGSVLLIPIPRADADGFKEKKAVWIGTREHGKRSVYFRCLACFAINAFGTHTPANIAVDGAVAGCEICSKCQTHQFIQLEGWADYLSEDQMQKRRKP